ncbi:N-[(2S)-2-amino-2-carboxyethyl]-L-glutamate dehydrogenase SbnB [Polycladomyces abyssicola]|uniref:N-[(2S)-2-amino-2-carboxyethyl]-L-glutamate dehydrogenase SbnB n=1 Tax=Polycladomyces abyssicola TaxID=1125966 RepID=A0A8D5UCI5_9BACL|nr:2,3-diaminopropionate biosynthesis protein SbnB [Polycladomyces abyssicola]BCU80727.1 N-[(2S)-2-amino-2-carboxyethyl]-L-glutamate dehydrogenase SbnB [Polycladomyces abyssicola]
MKRDHSILYLSREDIVKIGGESSDLYVQAVSRSLELHARKDFVQPLKPYLRVNNSHIADRIIAMPAYIGGEKPVSGLKWIGSKHDNPRVRGKERASGLIILNDPESNYPIAVMEASLISGMRTAAVTVIGARYLARQGFRSVACVGCGLIAHMQLRSLLEQFPDIATVHLFDLHQDAAIRLADELQERFPRVKAVVADSAKDAIREGEVIVTCTVTDTPYIPYEWLQKGAFVSNISIMDLHKEVFLKADKVVVDDWDQANREKKIINQLVLEGRFSREQLHAELGEILIGVKPGRETDDEIIVLNPMGMAVEDITSAQEVYQRALNANVGTWLSLY